MRPEKQGKTRGAAQTATPARMTPRVTFCPFWLVMTALTVISRNVSFTSVTVPLTVSTSPMNTGLANLHSTPWSRQCSPGRYTPASVENRLAPSMPYTTRPG